MKDFADIGVSIGRDQNAETTFDSTTFSLDLSEITPERLDLAFSWLRDVADGLTIPQDRGGPRARRHHVGVRRQPQRARRPRRADAELHGPEPARPQARADRPEGDHPDGERRHHPRLLPSLVPAGDLDRGGGRRSAARGAEGADHRRVRRLAERHSGADEARSRPRRPEAADRRDGRPPRTRPRRRCRSAAPRTRTRPEQEGVVSRTRDFETALWQTTLDKRLSVLANGDKPPFISAEVGARRDATTPPTRPASPPRCATRTGEAR